jgi:hypothetical protein
MRHCCETQACDIGHKAALCPSRKVYSNTRSCHVMSCQGILWLLVMLKVAAHSRGVVLVAVIQNSTVARLLSVYFAHRRARASWTLNSSLS